MLTLLFILALAALVTAIGSAMGKCPLWVPVMLLAFIACLERMPLGR